MLKYEQNSDTAVLGPPPIGLYEVVDGRYVVEETVSTQSEMGGSLLHLLIGSFVMANDLGHCAMETLFALPGIANKRRPDLAFVSYSRWPKRRRFSDDDGWQVVPEIAIEVMSPGNLVVEIERKLSDYFTAGVSEVWIVHPESETLHLYTSLSDVRILTRADTLICERFLPGFTLPLTRVFPEYDDPA